MLFWNQRTEQNSRIGRLQDKVRINGETQNNINGIMPAAA